MTIDKGIVERLMELREPSTDTLCAHDWVGDDDCVYCRNEKLERQIDVERMEALEQLDEKDRMIADLNSDLDTAIDQKLSDLPVTLKEKDAEIERLRGICHELVGDESYADIAYPPGY